jgi:hypothetical protein
LADRSDYSVRYGSVFDLRCGILGQRRSELSASLVISKYPSNIDVSEVGHDDESLTRSSLSIIKTLTDITLAL